MLAVDMVSLSGRSMHTEAAVPMLQYLASWRSSACEGRDYIWDGCLAATVDSLATLAENEGPHALQRSNPHIVSQLLAQPETSVLVMRSLLGRYGKAGKTGGRSQVNAILLSPLQVLYVKAVLTNMSCWSRHHCYVPRLQRNVQGEADSTAERVRRAAEAGEQLQLACAHGWHSR